MLMNSPLGRLPLTKTSIFMGITFHWLGITGDRRQKPIQLVLKSRGYSVLRRDALFSEGTYCRYGVQSPYG